jgi:tetrahydromethanopterin S-methyltransferase subunit G
MAKENKKTGKVTTDQLAIIIAAGFSRVDKRFEEVDKRFEEVDKRFEEVDKRFEEVDKKFNLVVGKFSGLEERLGQKIGGLSNRIDNLVDNKVPLETHKRLEDRVTRLEAVVLTKK